MKRKIRDNFYILKNIFTKENIIYLIIGIIGLNFYSCLSISIMFNYGIFKELSIVLLNSYYISILLLIIIFFSYIFLKNYRKRVELLPRFNTSKEYFIFLIKKVLILSTLIYLIHIFIVLIMFLFKYAFDINNNVFFLYNIPSSTYFVWSLIRNYIFIIFITYFFCYFNYYYENLSFIVLVVLLISLNIYINPNNVLSYLSFQNFIELRDFGSLLNEIAIFLIIYIVKFYVINFILDVIYNKKFNFRNIRNYIYKMEFNLSKTYKPLLFYLIINIYNLYRLIDNKIGFDLVEVLCTDTIRDNGVMFIATKGVSILAFALFFLKLCSIDLDNNSCIIFTRKSKRKWTRNKIILMIIIVLLFRLPLYLLVRRDVLIIHDFIIYIIIGILGIIYLLDNSDINLVFFMGSILFYLLLYVNEFIKIIFIFVIYIIYKLILYSKRTF